MSNASDQHASHGPQSPGLAGVTARMFIHSPLTPLFLVALLLIGLLGLVITPRQEDPQISVPMVDVMFRFPGASSGQVASLATDPLERMLSEIPGVEHVYSASERGGGIVTVQFVVGEKMEPSLVKLYDKLASNLDKIPPGVSQPMVKPRGIDDVPTATFTLWSSELDDASIRLISLEVLQRLKTVPDTAQSFIVGGRPEEIRVEVMPERLKGYGISVAQLGKMISAANDRSDIGTVESAGSHYRVYTGRFLQHARDIENLIVGVHNGAPVYVRQVAKVLEGPGEAQNFVQYFSGPAAGTDRATTKGAPAVTIAIAKKGGSNGVTVANDLIAKMETLKGTVIPDNVHVEITRNYGETANDKVNELLLKMFIATAAVCFLIYLFLGLRPTIVVLIVIPIVILVTVFSAWLLGFTIDRVSLFALIFSIGILVDDATVVVENIYRRWLIKGGIDTDTTVDAVREVGNPTILATFTVIAALLPMGFVSGMMGPYMMPIPVLGSVAMLLSLLAAFMFTPWLAIRIRPSLKELHKLEESEHKFSHRLSHFYGKVLTPLLDSPSKARIFRIVIWVAFLLCCLMFYTTHVTVKMLPLDNKPEFNVVVNMPEGTALPVTANLIQELAEETLKLPEVTAIQTYAGTASPFNFNGLVRHYYLRDKPWEGDVQVQLLHKSKRKRSSHQLAVEARERLTPIALKHGALIQVVEMPPGPPVLQTMVAEVYGPDDATRRKVAQDMTEIFRKAESIVDVDNYIQAPHDTWSFVVNQQKAEYQNVTIEDVTQQLAMVMGGQKLGAVKVGRELEARFIVIQAPLEVRSQFAQLGELPIQTRDNRLVPLAELGTFVRQPADPIIWHKDLRPIEYVTGEVAGRLAAPVYGMIEIAALLKDYKTPDGVTLSGYLVGPPEDDFKSGFEWTGEWTVTYETFRDMGLAFGAALVLIYMLVVMEFGNFRLPGIIMAPIPLTLIGIIPGHWLFGAEFTATSMIGWIALAGIIVRNSILLVDFSKHAIADGMPVRTAVLEAARTRTRPIVITSLALIAGSASILTDPIFQGMAISLLFGAVVSTALTLIVIPIACNRAAGAFSTANAYDEPYDDAHAGAAVQTAACAPSDKPGFVERLFVDDRAAPATQEVDQAGTRKGIVGMLLGAVATLAGVAVEALRHLLGKSGPAPARTTIDARPVGYPSSGLGARVSAFVNAIREAFAHLLGTTKRSVGNGNGNGGGGSSPPAGGAPVPTGGAPAPTGGAPVPAMASAATSSGNGVTHAIVEPTPAPVVITTAAPASDATAPAVTNGAAAPEVVATNAESDLAKIAASAAVAAAISAGQPVEAAKTDAAVIAPANPAPAGPASVAQSIASPAPQPAAPAAPVAAAAPVMPATGAKDDLETIHGIGPVVAAQLASLGVTTFAQIAAWKRADIERMEGVLAFKGRIDRENWVGQAQAIVLGGKPPKPRQGTQSATKRTASVRKGPARKSPSGNSR
ncbi:MAG: efflux RND transporter permease subunit [Hyphomicrobiaceae bacterium]|nr:efflux RND transporter permease subunit [Hyphomicrobiaceae bacterium]